MNSARDHLDQLGMAVDIVAAIDHFNVWAQAQDIVRSVQHVIRKHQRYAFEAMCLLHGI